MAFSCNYGSIALVGSENVSNNCTGPHFQILLMQLICVCTGSQVREGAKRKAFARDLNFGGSCVPKQLPLKTSPITGVLQVVRRIKRGKAGGQ